MNREQLVKFYNSIPFPVPEVGRSEWGQVGSMWFAPKYRVRVHTKHAGVATVRDGDTVVVISANIVRVLGEGMLVVAEGTVNRVVAAQMQVNICVCASGRINDIELVECDAVVAAFGGTVGRIRLIRPHVIDLRTWGGGRIEDVAFPEMSVSGRGGHQMLRIGDIE